jgi:GTP-binding protein
LVANKVDLAEASHEAYRSWFREKVAKEFHFFPDIKIVFTSAVTGKGLKDMFDTIVEIEDKITMRIKTRELNDFFIQTIRQAPAPVYNTRDVKFYYLTQTNQQPPAFIAFANHKEGVTPSYRRFLSKRIQEEFSLQGIPIRIFVMSGRHGSGRGRGTMDDAAVESIEQVEAVPGQDFEVDLELAGYDVEKLDALDPGAADFENAGTD